MCYILSSKLTKRYQKRFDVVVFNIGHKDSSHLFMTCNLITSYCFSELLVDYDNAHGSRDLLAYLAFSNWLLGDVYDLTSVILHI